MCHHVNIYIFIPCVGSMLKYEITVNNNNNDDDDTKTYTTVEHE